MFSEEEKGMRGKPGSQETKNRYSAAVLALVLAFFLAGSTAEIRPDSTGTALSFRPSACAAEEASSLPAEAVLELKPTELTLRVGATERILPSVDFSGGEKSRATYAWESSDPSVATCRGGTVRGLAKGSTEITCIATLANGTVLRASCSVEVIVPVKEIRIPQEKLQVMAGDPLTLEYEVLPEDASHPEVILTSLNEEAVRIETDGTLIAVAEGKAVVTVAAAENPAKKNQVTVTVTERIGKYDGEIRFQGLEWGTDHASGFQQLKDQGFVSPEAVGYFGYSSSIWHWPEEDLLFARSGDWRTLPVAFEDHRTGAGRISLDPEKTVGGYPPQTVTLVFLDGIDGDGKVTEEETHLIGVYLRYDNRHAEGSRVFTDLLEKLEAIYGKFSRYLAEGLERYEPETAAEIEAAMNGATIFRMMDLGQEKPLEDCAFCIIRGQEQTGIMLGIDSSENVTLFYGRTDVAGQIDRLRDALENENEQVEEAGL